MTTRATGFLLGLLIALPARAGEPLTLERIFASPSLDGTSPRSLKIAPDGSRVTFLRGKPDDQYRLDLWEYHLADGETRMLVDSAEVVPDEGRLSDEERARRERQRIAQFSGIVAYDWTADASALLFPLGGDIHLHRVADGETRRITETEAFETDARLSPEGGYVSFVRDRNLWILDLESGEERALTAADGELIRYGTAEFVAQEEMDRDTGYWWAPDDRHIALTRVDESPVRVERRYEVYGDRVDLLEQRYPAAGTPNARVQLGVVPVEGGEIRWLDLGNDDEIYLARVDWLPDGRRLAVQRQNRDQKRLDLLLFDLDDGSARTLLSEEHDTWIDLHDDLRFLADREAFVWSSERSGYRHLYLFDLEGRLVRQLTSGDWRVAELEALDGDAGVLWFTGHREGPTTRHLYRVSLAGGEPERLTERAGWHEVEMPPEGGLLVDSFSSRNQPPQVSVHGPDGERLAWLSENALDEDHPYAPFLDGHGPSRYGTLGADDGTTLHWQLTVPRDFDETRRYPVIIHVYGGPTGQMVRDAWSRRVLIEQYWTRRGFLVFSLDNRGVEGYGQAFQDPAFRRLGVVETADQAEGARWLREQPFVDGDRIGVFGWSYGGYMTLMMLMQDPELYAAGAAVAPVTDWSLYDTHYTERYMGTPEDNAEGYRQGDVLTWADGLADPLLLIHGMADDNVLFTNSTRLMESLQQKALPFDLMTYPGGKHGLVGDAVRVHVYGTISRFFERHLEDRGDGSD